MTSKKFPEDEDLILVAIIPSLKDLEIAKVLGWYRIPLRSAPKLISVDYIAFYQPSVFGKQGKRITFLSNVMGHELTTRSNLLQDDVDHPRANEEYYKIQIGPLMRLPSPILAEKWKRITFFYTTGAYLRKAEKINDLVVKDEDRRNLWRSLRERSENPINYDENSGFDLPSDPEILALLGILPKLK